MKPDIVPVSVGLYFIPIELRIPLKFGPEITTEVVCARVRMTVANKQGQKAQGWGETPLSVQWTWPGTLSYEERCEALQQFCRMLAEAWARFGQHGHPMELGSEFIETVLKIEHDIISRQKARANIIVNNDYSITPVKE